MKEFINVFKEFTNMTGRISRRDYWLAYLVQMGISILYSIISILIVRNFQQQSVYNVLNHIDMIYGIFACVPFFTAAVRRLHDTGRSGFNLFWLLLPIIGWIAIFIFLVEKTRNEDNKFVQVSKPTKIIVPIVWLVISIIIYFGLVEPVIRDINNDDYNYMINGETEDDYYGTWEYQKYTDYKESENDVQSGYTFKSYDVDLSDYEFDITYDYQAIEKQNDQLVKTAETENYASGTLQQENGKFLLLVEDSDIPNINVNDKLECSIDENNNLVLNIPGTNETYTLTSLEY